MVDQVTKRTFQGRRAMADALTLICEIVFMSLFAPVKMHAPLFDERRNNLVLQDRPERAEINRVLDLILGHGWEQAQVRYGANRIAPSCEQWTWPWTFTFRCLLFSRCIASSCIWNGVTTQLLPNKRDRVWHRDILDEAYAASCCKC